MVFKHFSISEKCGVHLNKAPIYSDDPKFKKKLQKQNHKNLIGPFLIVMFYQKQI